MQTNHFLVPSGDKDELLYAWAEVVARVLLNHSSGPSRSIFVHDCESAPNNIRANISYKQIFHVDICSIL